MYTKDSDSWLTIARTTDVVDTVANLITELNCMNTIAASSAARIRHGIQSYFLDLTKAIFKVTPFKTIVY